MAWGHAWWGNMHAWEGGMHAWQLGMHGRVHVWQGACATGGMHNRGHAWHGVYMAGGMYGRGCAWHGCMHGGGGGHMFMTGETATAADGTYPSEMHSSLTNEIKGKK